MTPDLENTHAPDWWRRPGGPFTESVIAAACAHAAREAPRESVGAVVDGAYLPLENVAEDPAAQFMVGAEAAGALFASGMLEGFVHSHPGGPAHPSAADMRGQRDSAVPWAIVIPGEDGGRLACRWGDGTVPLFDAAGAHLPREFLHGVADCYTLIRDWQAEARGLALPDYPRDWEWWAEPGANLYLDNLEDAGFRVVSRDQAAFAGLAQPGDVYLMAIRAKAPNHGGVYLGDGLALEHMPGRLSGARPVGPLLRHATHWLRREA